MSILFISFLSFRKVPLEDGANPPLELPLVGATSSSSNTIVASNNTVNITDDPSAKPPSRGVSGGLRKKKVNNIYYIFV